GNSFGRCVSQRDVQVNGLGGSIERDDEPFLFGFTQEDIRGHIGAEVPERPGLQCWVLATNAQQVLHVRKCRLLFRFVAFGSESVARILLPTSWKVTSIVGIASSRHVDLVAVIKLGNPTQREDKTERESELRG